MASRTLPLRRIDLRWALVAGLALCVGAFGAEAYARLAAPCYEAMAAWIARAHPWTITSIEVGHEGDHPGLFLRLYGEVRAAANAAAAARVITRVQIGAVIEGPLIFWAILLAWPRSARSRLIVLACGLPIFLGLEGATTVCQLLNGFADASRLIAGNPDPATAWENWSRFIESGGRDVLAVCGALASLTLAAWLDRAVAAQ